MRSLLLAACAAFYAVPVFGQINVISVDRRVESLAWINYEFVDSERPELGVQTIDLRDHPIDRTFGVEPFSALVTATVGSENPIVTAGATVEAWQESTIDDSGVTARGGVRNADRYGGANGTQAISARSVLEITFSINRNTQVILDGDLVQPPMQIDGRGLDDSVILTGDVLYSLTGPVPALVDPPQVVVHNLDLIDATPQRFDRMEMLVPGTYTLVVSAALADNATIPAHWVNFRDVSYDVRMVVMPEPSTWLMVALALAFGLYRARRHCGFRPATTLPSAS